MAYSRTGAEPTSTSLRQTEQQHRRRQSRGFHVPPEGLTNHYQAAAAAAAEPTTTEMSLDHSPSREHDDGGWSSPGLSTPYENGDRGKTYGDLNGNGVTWTKARAKSARVQGQEQSQQQQGFVARHYRRLSESLPYFAHGGQEDRFAEKEKLGRGRAGGANVAGMGRGWRQVPRRAALLVSRKRKYVALGLLVMLAVVMWFYERECAVERKVVGSGEGWWLTYIQHYSSGIDERRFWAAAASSSSSSRRTKEEG